jgi:OHCU decarboxylase
MAVWLDCASSVGYKAVDDVGRRPVTTVAELDAMPAERAAELLRACCGAARWVSAMLARRPFGSEPALLRAADEVWQALDPTDWREAFAHHPRLGEAQSTAPQDERARGWSSTEQVGLRDAATDVLVQLVDANARYEARFGYICIICATGRGAEEMLAITRARLGNSAEVELRVSAEEQRRITRLRLEKLLHDSPERR